MKLRTLLTTTVACAALTIPAANAAILFHVSASDLALSDGASVAAWGSLAAAGGEQPTYRAAGMNGNPSVDFNGTSNTMGGGVAISGARSIVAVTTLDTGASSLAGLASNDNDSFNFRRDGTNARYRAVGQGGDNNDFYRHGNHAGQDNVYINGVGSSTLTYGQSHVAISNAGAVANFTDFTLGRAAPSGGAANRWWKGDISEVYVFDQTLTNDEIVGVSSILADRWGSTAVSATSEQIAAGNAVLGIPEPSAFALVGLAGFGLVLRRRR